MEEENERNLRKLFFAAAVDIPDPMLSNFAQPLVRIALKLLELLRAHRAAHGAGGGYIPPDDAAQDHWMQTDSDLVEAVEELDAEFNTQYVKDKIDSTTGAGAVERAAKRASGAKYTSRVPPTLNLNPTPPLLHPHPRHRCRHLLFITLLFLTLQESEEAGCFLALLFLAPILPLRESHCCKVTTVTAGIMNLSAVSIMEPFPYSRLVQPLMKCIHLPIS